MTSNFGKWACALVTGAGFSDISPSWRVANTWITGMALHCRYHDAQYAACVLYQLGTIGDDPDDVHRGSI